jgi:hypothetical protein
VGEVDWCSVFLVCDVISRNVRYAVSFGSHIITGKRIIVKVSSTDLEHFIEFQPVSFDVVPQGPDQRVSLGTGYLGKRPERAAAASSRRLSTIFDVRCVTAPFRDVIICGLYAKTTIFLFSSASSNGFSANIHELAQNEA